MRGGARPDPLGTLPFAKVAGVFVSSWTSSTLAGASTATEAGRRHAVEAWVLWAARRARGLLQSMPTLAAVMGLTTLGPSGVAAERVVVAEGAMVRATDRLRAAWHAPRTPPPCTPRRSLATDRPVRDRIMCAAMLQPESKSSERRLQRYRGEYRTPAGETASLCHLRLLRLPEVDGSPGVGAARMAGVRRRRKARARASPTPKAKGGVAALRSQTVGRVGARAAAGARVFTRPDGDA